MVVALALLFTRALAPIDRVLSRACELDLVHASRVMPRYGQPVMLLTTDWHPWFSYEWWRDIGTGLLTICATTTIGAVTVWVAARSSRVARETVEYTKRVREEDGKRQERERLRQAQIERIAFAGLVRTWVRAVNDADAGPMGSENSEIVLDLRTQLGDLVYDFDQQGRQELLTKIDAIVSTRRDIDESPDWRSWWAAREIRKTKIPALIEGYIAGSHLPHYGLPVEHPTHD